MNKEATLIHFHGPKVGAIQAIVEEKWNWRSEHEQQIGSMFLGFIDSYLEAFEAIKEYFPELPAEESDRLSELFIKASQYDGSRHKDKTSLDFMNFRMFPEGE